MYLVLCTNNGTSETKFFVDECEVMKSTTTPTCCTSIPPWCRAAAGDDYDGERPGHVLPVYMTVEPAAAAAAAADTTWAFITLCWARKKPN